jgi:hypothetical protein
MRANAILFLILGIFFWAASGVYILWSVIDPSRVANLPEGSADDWWIGIEWVGALGIFLSGVLSGLISFYLGRVHKGQGGELPEDRGDALIDDGDAEQGFFSPWSWWPVMLAGSAALVFIGVAAGFWIAFIGGAVLVVSLVGWQYEYYRGYFAH